MLITNLEAWICLVVVIGFRINSLVGATYEDNVVDCRNNTVQIAIWTLHLVRSILCFWKQECGTNDMNVKKWSPWTPLYKSLHSSGTITKIEKRTATLRSALAAPHHMMWEKLGLTPMPGSIQIERSRTFVRGGHSEANLQLASLGFLVNFKHVHADILLQTYKCTNHLLLTWRGRPSCWFAFRWPHASRCLLL